MVPTAHGPSLVHIHVLPGVSMSEQLDVIREQLAEERAQRQATSAAGRVKWVHAFQLEQVAPVA